MGRAPLTVGAATRAIIAALEDEMARQGVTRTATTRRAGIGTNRSGIIFRLESPITFEETRMICDALNISLVELVRDTEQRWDT